MFDFGVLGELPSVDDVKSRINSRYDNLFTMDAGGKRVALVCSFCDEFLLKEGNVNYVPIEELRIVQDLFSWSRHFENINVIENSPRIPELEEQFQFKFDDPNLEATFDFINFKDLAMSPRGCIGKKNRNSRMGFSCCNKCYEAIKKRKTPFYAIVNRNHVGFPPKVLTELTPLELSLLTPVKGYGYCFTYMGGAQMNLKGSMTFMGVEESVILRGSAQLDRMYLDHMVVIVLTGKMTSEQKKLASREIRVDMLLDAAKWLHANNQVWKEVDLENFQETMRNYTPLVVDQSSTVESMNSNIEKHQLFSVYMPDDGSMEQFRGGFKDNEEYKKFVAEMKQRNFQVKLNFDLGRDYVHGNEAALLTRMCLLQFPYGVGGITERRITYEESYSDYAFTESYFEHLSRLSQNVFQESMFQLVCYSILTKWKMLNQTRFHVKGEHSAAALANGLNLFDVQNTIAARSRGDRFSGTQVSKAFLGAIDACSRSLPHSNEAAAEARSSGEALQHHLGIGTVFLTVTFDDDNSLLMQILADDVVDKENDVFQGDGLEEMSKELGLRRDGRRQLRLKYPGLCALHFESLLNIVVQEVIGWDMEKHKPNGIKGLFGKPEGLAVAFEEQGRRSIHAHMTIFVEGFKDIRHRMFFGTESQVAEANQLVAKYHEHIVSTTLFVDHRRTLQKCFDHGGCPVPWYDRELPVLCSTQKLRDLRHKKGYATDNGKICSCSSCDKKWSYEEMVNEYVRHVGNVPYGFREISSDDCTGMEKSVQIPGSFMKAKIIEYQKKPNFVGNDITTMFINATYNHHFSFHTSGCFKCNKKKKSKHTCGPTCECRMRYPDKERTQTIPKHHGTNNSWFSINGEERKQPIVEILPKRTRYNVLQNTSCRAISESKLACNTNASIITDGPVAQYQFKYQHKGTQQDDSRDYKRVEDAMRKISTRKHDDDRKEALRRICRAAFAHNSNHVVGAPLASFLIRNGSRFYFSHELVYCPISDLRKLLKKETVSATAQLGPKDGFYFENQALHYLCRHEHLDDLSPKQFFELYMTVNSSGKKRRRNNENSETTFRYQNTTGYFQHPSAKVSKNRKGITKIGEASQFSVKRTNRAYIKVPQWMFPDTGSFHGNILTCTSDEICPAMEKYAELVLMLLMNYRSESDFRPEGSKEDCPLIERYPYVHKYREIWKNEVLKSNCMEKTVFSTENISYLQNIQDTAYNGMRYKVPKDDLQSGTEPFQCGKVSSIEVPDIFEEEKEPEEEHPSFSYETMLAMVEDSISSTDSDMRYLAKELKTFSFMKIRDRGASRSGHIQHLSYPLFARSSQGNQGFIVRTNEGRDVNTSDTNENRSFSVPSIKSVVELLFTNSSPTTRTNVFHNNPTAIVMKANGSLKSIFDWAICAKLDQLQRRAFEVIVAAFLLTFFVKPDKNVDIEALLTSTAEKYKKLLITLTGTTDGRIVFLVLGPGGSGKSTVINLALAYCREYCENLGHPFTRNTFLVSAMSGVAATLIHGETTHRAFGLNKRRIGQEMIDSFSDNRMNIIDECSFLCEKYTDKLQGNTCILHRGKNIMGGANIVMTGDFGQLPAVGNTPLWEQDVASFHGAVNVFLELNGNHRFRHDPEWGRLLSRMRDGHVTVQDIELINRTCLVSETRRPNENVQLACFFNKERDAANCCIFENVCARNSLAGMVSDVSVAIFMDNLEMKDHANTFVRVSSNSLIKWFYSNCGESACETDKFQSSKVDPVLKLYQGCPLMLTKNANVSGGEAKGSRVYLEKVHVIGEEQPFEFEFPNSVKMLGYFASQIRCITVRHEMTEITPNLFKVFPENLTFSTKVECDSNDLQQVRMKGYQFPLISNSATTGHKLQGYTANELLVIDWNYQQNWPYTVLSRVTHMDGLYILKPLSRDLRKYSHSASLDRMLNRFRQECPLPMLTPANYEWLKSESDRLLSIHPLMTS